MVRKGKDSWLHLQQVVHYAKTGEYLGMVTTTEKNGIRKAAANLVVEGKSLSSLSLKCNMYFCSGVI